MISCDNNKHRIFNFSAGPAMIPITILRQIKKELYNWQRTKTSILEISHRSKEFIEIAETSEKDLRELLSIPENYKVLFCHGGARAQFSAIPMNLLGNSNIADYINSGYWSYNAIIEAKKYCQPKSINVVFNVKNTKIVKPMHEWILSVNSAYVHYCPNETIEGLAINELPNFDKKIIVGDFSSTILSRPLDINRFGVIYASAQKNIGPAGLTIVIIREDLLGYACNKIPSILNYKILAQNNSMFNTPPTFAWYLSGLMFKWIKAKGGLVEMNKLNKIKANLLYQIIDKSNFYYNNVASINRSYMNITFKLANSKLDDLFIKEANSIGLYALKGHKAIGGIRASLYNAMPLAGVQALVKFMKWFVRRYG